jgi:hypothetical protein
MGILRVAITRTVVAMFALPRHLTRQRPAGSVGGAVDGDIEVGLGILDQHVGGAGNRHLDAAALVFSTARTIEIGETDRNLAHVLMAQSSAK